MVAALTRFAHLLISPRTRRRFGNMLAADHPTRAAAMVDDEGLAEGFGEFGRQRACHDVGRAAGGEGHDEAHGFHRISRGLRVGGGRKQRHHRQSGESMRHLNRRRD